MFVKRFAGHPVKSSTRRKASEEKYNANKSKHNTPLWFYAINCSVDNTKTIKNDQGLKTCGLAV